MDQEGREAVSFALQQLANSDWRIRAAAAEGLLSLGKSGVRAAFTLLPEASESVRIGIARMVIHSADEDLLNEFIQCCSQPVSTQSANAISQPHPQCGSS
jgi:HEAT repeat protein